MRTLTAVGIVSLALLSFASVGRGSPETTHAQGCHATAERHYGGASAGVTWGDEVTVSVVVTVNCPIGGAGRLSVTERLPGGIDLVQGIGAPPDEATGRDVTWRVDPPHGTEVRFTYRVYTTPPVAGFDAEGLQHVGWPMVLDLVVGGQPQRQAAPTLDRLTVRERRVGMTCGLSRRRTIAPDPVTAGQPFTVSLRLILGDCPTHATRTRGVLALQPVTDSQELRHLQMAVTRVLGQLSPANAMMGLVVNASAAPATQAPTTEYIFVDTLARSMAPAVDGGGDAADALRAALDLVPDWPYHHEAVFYVTHGGAPRADAAVVADLLAEAADRGVEIVPVCVGGGCDPALDYAHDFPRHYELLQAAVGVLDGHRGAPLVVTGLEIEDNVHRFVELLPGGQPPAETLGGSTVRWSGLAIEPVTPVDVSYLARVGIWGRLPLGPGGMARLHYGDGGTNTFALPRGTVRLESDPNAAELPCTPRVTKTASPRRVPLGDAVEVRLGFGALCPAGSSPVDVVLALDVSGSMKGQKIEDAREAARSFLDVVEGGPIRVGIVTFNNAVVALRPLSGDLLPARDVVGRMVAGGGTDIALALDAARQLLWDRRPGAASVVLLMTDGWSDEAAFIAASEEVRAEGNLVVSVCFGGSCSPALKDAASAPQYHYEVLTAEDLILLFAELGARLRQKRVAALEIVDELPPHVRYVDGSAVPPPAEVHHGRFLIWRLADPAPGATEVRYRVEPLLLGEQPVNVRATAAFVDDAGLEGFAEYPVPVVETFIPDPEGPCDPRLGKAAVPVRVAVGQPVSVTLSLEVDCPKREAAADVVLILDHSDSMRALDRLVNAKAAAGEFLDLVDPGTRVGLVTFSTDVSGRVALTEDLAAVRAAVDGLRPGGTTAISRALDAARELLADRRSEAVGAVVLLTDGHITVGSVADMLTAADRLKGDGARVFTVCAGECDEELPLVASRPGYHFDVRDSALLVDVFRDLATNLTGGRAHDLVVTDAFPTAIEVEAGSLSPPSEGGVTDGAVWRFPVLPSEGLTITYRVRSRVAGRVPVNRFARLDYGFGIGQPGRAFFPVPVLEVAGPTATATPGGGPTATPTPTDRPSPVMRAWLPAVARHE